MKGMFYGCTQLTKMDFQNFNTDNLTGVSDLFYIYLYN